ncbi:hypothetical protein EV702DRAFT_1191397 [Suillus placidus]|uniref:Uncharacterized protein n=1 Tax=Suillus placidus TaxID=48579 RepID=A0A9P7A5N5_9AGAM|nr:hypothetical protein EV702DRAFT_1191397 [Suillus placidus]
MTGDEYKTAGGFNLWDTSIIHISTLLNALCWLAVTKHQCLVVFLECKELVEEVFQNLPHITDANAWGDTFHTTHAVKGDILGKRFMNIVAPFADGHSKRLCSVLYDSRALITGSCATSMLMGPSDTRPCDLNILVTAAHFKVLECFFRHALGYEWLEHTSVPHTAIFKSVERFVRYML